MTLPLSARPLNGCLFTSTPVEAPQVSAPSGASLPNLVDLRGHCSPVEDQRRTNSCTANAIVGALEYHQRRAGHDVVDLSRMFVYYNARQLAGAESKDVGSFIHHVMAAVLAHGACEERLWPFQEAMCTVRPPDAAYGDARRFQAVQYARTPLGEPALAALASGLPVVFGTYAPRAFYDEAGRTGVMPGPAAALERPGGGHAMLLVGYDREAETWLVRNSWGPGYADEGYLRIPFATLAAYSKPTDFWTIGAVANAPFLGPLENAGALGGPAAQESGAPSALEGAAERARQRARELMDGAEERQRSRSSLRDRLGGS